MQGNQRFVIFSFLAAGGLLWATFAKIFGAIAYAADLPDAAILGNQFTVSTLLGMLVGVGAVIFALKHAPSYTFAEEVVAELRKVTWPDRKETQTATVVVIVTTLVIAAILGVFDLVWAKLTGFIYSA